MVQGEVKIENNTIEDFIILRKDGTLLIIYPPLQTIKRWVLLILLGVTIIK